MTELPELVAAATVGLAQRPLRLTALAAPADRQLAVLGTDPAEALLDAVALLDAARRAGGAGPGSAPPPPAAAPADPSPEPSAAAAALLRDVLVAGDRELIGELLTALAEAGLRAPAPELPMLLGLAARVPALRARVAAVLGARGRWLAAQLPEWRRLADQPSDTAGTSDAAALDPRAWEHGRPGERLGYLSALRDADPDAARELLALDWARETGEERANLLAALAVRLGPADEPFLEAALDDRRAEVRTAARGLLAALPGSAFQRRARDRAAGVLRLAGERLVVTLPDPPDAPARRDGLTPTSPYRRLGDRAWQLVQVIAGAPLALWRAELDAGPDELVTRPIDGDFAAELYAGWRLATRREQDAGWAAALLGTPVGETHPDEQLLALLDPATRVERALVALREGRSSAATEVLACRAPWPAPLTAAVLGSLAGRLRAADPGTPGEVVGAVGRGVALVDAPAALSQLHGLAERFRAHSLEVPAAGRWAAPIERAAGLLELRLRFHQLLAERPGPPGPAEPSDPPNQESP